MPRPAPRAPPASTRAGPRRTGDLRIRTDRFLIEDGNKLLDDLDEAALALAKGDGRTKPRDKVADYQKGRKLLQKYVDDLTRLRRDGDVLSSIADDLLDDAAAVIAEVDALIAG